MRQVRFDTYLFRIALVRIVPPPLRGIVFHAISCDTSVLRPCRNGRTLVTVLRCELGTRIGPQHLRLRKITNVRGLRFASKRANPILRIVLRTSFRGHMKNLCFAVLLLCAVAGYAMPIASSARSMVPSELQQLIGVDYRAVKDSPTAMALKQQVLPDHRKELETALKGVGIDAERDLDQLNFASFRTEKKGIETIGVASGSFSAKAVLKKMTRKKIAATKYGTARIYPMDNGLVMTFLDDNTLAFGTPASLHSALDTRDGKRPSLDSNSVMTDQMSAVDGAAVWSILDQKGTQAMMFSALGDAAKVADYETLKKRILASRYTMNFQSGVNFDLSVLTADSMTAATLSTIVKAGMLYKKLNASPVEKTAIDATTVDSDSSNVQLHFKSDDQKFQSLMHSPLFAAVSH